MQRTCSDHQKFLVRGYPPTSSQVVRVREQHAELNSVTLSQKSMLSISQTWRPFLAILKSLGQYNCPT